MAHLWRGVLREYADRLGVTDASTVVTLGEGGTLYVPDDEEREDLTKFYMAASATTMTAEEAAEVGNGDL